MDGATFAAGQSATTGRRAHHDSTEKSEVILAMIKRRNDLQRSIVRLPVWLTVWEWRGGFYHVINPFCAAFWRENWQMWGSLYAIRYWLTHPVKLWWK